MITFSNAMFAEKSYSTYGITNSKINFFHSNNIINYTVKILYQFLNSWLLNKCLIICLLNIN